MDKPTRRATWGQILIVDDEVDGGAPAEIGELYDPATNRFATQPPVMSKGAGGATATVITVGPNAGKVLLTGGGSGESGPLDSSVLYDPATDTFADGPHMNERRESHTATTISVGPHAGWIFIVGGDYTNLYDPLTNRMLPGPENPVGRWGHTATVIPSGPNAGRILIVGGWQESAGARPSGELRSCEIYDPISNRFEPLSRTPRMNVARQAHTATLLTTGPNAGKLLIIGGWGRHGPTDALNSTELYDPETNSFAPPKATPKMRWRRAYHTATTIPSGRRAGSILVAGGGLGGSDETFSSTELYDPITGRFLPGPSMRSPRTQHFAIALRSGPNAGKILIVGGDAPDCRKPGRCIPNFLKSTELYNPAIDKFALGPDMHGSASGGAIVQLPAAPH